MENNLNYLLNLFSLDSIKHSNKENGTKIVNNIKENYINQCSKIKLLIEEIESLKNNIDSLKNELKIKNVLYKYKTTDLNLLKEKIIIQNNYILNNIPEQNNINNNNIYIHLDSNYSNKKRRLNYKIKFIYILNYKI